MPIQLATHSNNCEYLLCIHNKNTQSLRKKVENIKAMRSGDGNWNCENSVSIKDWKIMGLFFLKIMGICPERKAELSSLYHHSPTEIPSVKWGKGRKRKSQKNHYCHLHLLVHFLKAELCPFKYINMENWQLKIKLCSVLESAIYSESYLLMAQTCAAGLCFI